MASIAVPKTLLLLLLLSVIPALPVCAADVPQVYRFGEWTVLAPAAADPSTLASGGFAMGVPPEGLELLAYWQDGSQRAVALRFDALDAKKDAVVMKSFNSASRLKGCAFGAGARIKSYRDAVPKEAKAAAFPDNGALQLKGSDRGLRRAGDVLVVDMGTARVQLAEDSPTVRVGEWDSADFCRFELKNTVIRDDD